MRIDVFFKLSEKESNVRDNGLRVPLPFRKLYDRKRKKKGKKKKSKKKK